MLIHIKIINIILYESKVSCIIQIYFTVTLLLELICLFGQFEPLISRLGVIPSLQQPKVDWEQGSGGQFTKYILTYCFSITTASIWC